MKKITSLLLAFILLFAVLLSTQASEYMNVYALDGRVEVIRTSDFDAWHAVGWYSAPVMTVYSLDGRTEIIPIADFNAWHAVGWYSAPMMYVYSADGRIELITKADYYEWNLVGWYSDTPIMVYAPDGRSQYIPKNEFSQWQSAGWYSAPVMYMYAPDGRVQLILKSEFSKWQKSGWYTKPVVTIYSGNKSKVVPKEDFQSWKNVGWDTYVKLYFTDGSIISVLTDEVEYGYYYGDFYRLRNNDSLSQIEWSPNGTNITLEQAKKIAQDYCNKIYRKYGIECIYPNLVNYSDSAYLISVRSHEADGVQLISVNKTTGYVFLCGAGSDGWAEVQAVY